MAASAINAQHQAKPRENPTDILTTSIEKNPLDPDLIRSLLEVVPEMQELENLLDARCYALHEDEKLDCFSKIFQQIIDENWNLFSAKTPLEKAEILFNFHSRELISPLACSDKFQAFINYFFQNLENSYKTDHNKGVIISEAIKQLRNHVRILHSSYICLAIADTLKISAHINPFSFSQAEELKITISPGIRDVYK